MPFTTNFSQLFESLRNTGGLERIMDFIFLGTGSANGYDALGHFLRAEGVGNALPRIRGHAVDRRWLPAQTVQQLRHRGERRQRSERFGGERRKRNERADGAHARGAQRRDAGTGAREIPGRDDDERGRSSAHRA